MTPTQHVPNGVPGVLETKFGLVAKAVITGIVGLVFTIAVAVGKIAWGDRESFVAMRGAMEAKVEHDKEQDEAIAKARDFILIMQKQEQEFYEQRKEAMEAFKVIAGQLVDVQRDVAVLKSRR